MSRFLNWLKQDANAYRRDETKDRILHSASYHKFYRGYAERKISKGKKNRIERVYVADYYRYAGSDFKWKLYKGIYICLILTATVLLISTQSIYHSRLNQNPMIGALELLGLVPLTFLLFEMLMHLVTKRFMTIDDFETANKGVKKGAMIECIYVLILIICMVVLMILDGINGPAEIETVAGQLISLSLFGAIFVLEKRRAYEIVKNKREMHSDANQIW